MHPRKGDTDLARRRSLRRFERTTAAAPTRKRQLGMSIARSLPKYQFCVMFSVLTTRALLFGYTCSPTSNPNHQRPRLHPHNSSSCPDAPVARDRSAARSFCTC